MMTAAQGVSARIKGAVMRRLSCCSLPDRRSCRDATRRRFRRADAARVTSPFIPAPPTYTRWSGFYVGGQVGCSSAEHEFRRRDRVAGRLHPARRRRSRTSSIRPNGACSAQAIVSGPSFGGFVGYNSQWDDVIVGVELQLQPQQLLRPIAPVTSDRAAPSAAGGNNYDRHCRRRRLDAHHRLWHGARSAPAGSSATSCPMRRSASRSAAPTSRAPRSVVGDGIRRPLPSADPVRPDTVRPVQLLDQPKRRTTRFIYGWSAGGGVDVLLMPNVFVRGEYEYVQLRRAPGHQGQISTARVGAGFKF